MRSILPALTALAALLSAAAPALAQQEVLRQEEEPVVVGREYVTPRVSFLYADLHGRVENDEGPDLLSLTEGTGISLDSELGLGDTRPLIPMVELIWADSDIVGDSTHTYELVNVSFLYADFENTETMDQLEVFNGVSFPAGTSVESSFRVWMAGLDVSVAEDSLGPDAEGEIFVGLRLWDTHVSMKGPVADTDEDLRMGFIGLGVGARWHPGRFVGLSVRTGAYVSSWSEDSIFEYEESVAVHYEGQIALLFEFRRVRIQLGARIIAAAADIIREDDDAGEEYSLAWTLGGPFVDISIAF